VRKLAVGGIVATFLVAGIALAYAVYRAELAPGVGSNRGSDTIACSPAPCADIQGYQVWITGLQAAGGSVQMMVSFRNSSGSTHADPSDFGLIDSTGNTWKPEYSSPNCRHWPRTEFSHGARRGPFPLCFRPTSRASPFRLAWSPDFGFFCCDAKITLVQ